MGRGYMPHRVYTKCKCSFRGPVVPARCDHDVKQTVQFERKRRRGCAFQRVPPKQVEMLKAVHREIQAYKFTKRKIPV